MNSLCGPEHPGLTTSPGDHFNSICGKIKQLRIFTTDGVELNHAYSRTISNKKIEHSCDEELEGIPVRHNCRLIHNALTATKGWGNIWDIQRVDELYGGV